MSKNKGLIDVAEQGEDFRSFPELLCLCGHSRRVHENDNTGFIILKNLGNHWCRDCCLDKAFHTFKLDNLSLVEFEAKKRGLI
jgi:hypothetical protein